MLQAAPSERSWCAFMPISISGARHVPAGLCSWSDARRCTRSQRYQRRHPLNCRHSTMCAPSAIRWEMIYWSYIFRTWSNKPSFTLAGNVFGQDHTLSSLLSWCVPAQMAIRAGSLSTVPRDHDVHGQAGGQCSGASRCSCCSSGTGWATHSHIPQRCE